MTTEYEVSRTGGQCGTCGRVFAEGEEFTSVVLEAQEGFARRDVCLSCWREPPPEAVCFFKTRLAKKEKSKKTFVDDEVLIDFFLRLADSEEPHKQRFRFVLSLILLRMPPAKVGFSLAYPGRWLRDIGLLYIVMLPLVYIASREAGFQRAYPFFAFERLGTGSLLLGLGIRAIGMFAW